jgi:hypothetical protein
VETRGPFVDEAARLDLFGSRLSESHGLVITPFDGSAHELRSDEAQDLVFDVVDRTTPVFRFGSEDKRTLDPKGCGRGDQ